MVSLHRDAAKGVSDETLGLALCSPYCHRPVPSGGGVLAVEPPCDRHEAPAYKRHHCGPVVSATGRDLGESDPVGTVGCGASVVQRMGVTGREILAGTSSGYLRFRYRAGRLFGNGFE